jgi:hypothetical protein
MNFQRLNRNQKKVLLGALAVIVLMGLCPPWMCTSQRQFIHEGNLLFRIGPHAIGKPLIQESFEGYYWLFMPPQSLSYYDRDSNMDVDIKRAQSYGYHIAFGILLLQWFMVALIAGGLLCYFREAQPSPSNEPRTSNLGLEHYGRSGPKVMGTQVEGEEPTATFEQGIKPDRQPMTLWYPLGGETQAQ